MLAVLVSEIEYPNLGDLSSLMVSWARLWGPLAIAVLLLVELFRHLRSSGSIWNNGLAGRLADLPAEQVWKIRTFRLWLVLIPIGIALAAVIYYFASRMNDQAAQAQWFEYSNSVFALACLAAILAVSWEFLLDLANLKVRRIWAISRLTILEAVRGKALWGFSVLLLVFLFASWFVRSDKPEHQWRIYVDLVFFVMAALLMITSSVLACFSLPTDIRRQTIHTVITKPVQRIEVVLGRIGGYTLLMTLVLFVVAHLSLLYVFRGIDPTARRDTMRARVAEYGFLRFEELDGQGNWVVRGEGVKVGREWDYRDYIRGGSTQEAVWSFPQLSGADAGEDHMIPVEFSFDIFRTTKGGDDYKEGVSCQFSFINLDKWHFGRYNEYRTALESQKDLAEHPYDLARRFGFYELPTPIHIVDYENYTVWFPSSVLEGARQGQFEIRVACRTHAQYLGMARYDLYILAAEGSVYLNYMKGVIGLWSIMVILVTLGVVFSTYLNALVGLLLTWMMMLCGTQLMRQFIQTLISPDPEINPGGGPFEALVRLAQRENLTTPLEPTRGVWVIQHLDDAMRFLFKGYLYILPDLGLHWRTNYIAEGFDIPGGELLTALILLAAYIFPYLIAGYYLLTAREVAQ